MEKSYSSAERAEYLLTKTNCALIVIDMQNDYCHPDGACSARGSDVSGADKIIAPMQKLIGACKRRKIPVIFIQTEHTTETDSEAWLFRSGGTSSGVCRKGTWGTEFYGVHPDETDIVVNKHRYSAFIHTRLESVLHTLKIQTIITVGVSTNICVESTARDGFMLDFNLIVVPECCASSSSAEAHNMALKNIDLRFGTVAPCDDVCSYIEKQIKDGN